MKNKKEWAFIEFIFGIIIMAIIFFAIAIIILY